MYAPVQELILLVKAGLPYKLTKLKQLAIEEFEMER